MFLLVEREPTGTKKSLAGGIFLGAMDGFVVHVSDTGHHPGLPQGQAREFRAEARAADVIGEEEASEATVDGKGLQPGGREQEVGGGRSQGGVKRLRNVQLVFGDLQEEGGDYGQRQRKDHVAALQGVPRVGRSEHGSVALSGVTVGV